MTISRIERFQWIWTMAYNWNGELTEQRKHLLMMKMTLGLSAISFIVVLVAIGYFLTHRDSGESSAYFPQTHWELRN